MNPGRLNLWIRRGALRLLAAFVRPRRVSREGLRRARLSRILVVRQDDRIGNLLFVTPLVRALKTRFPDAAIDVVVSSRFSEILDHHPAVSSQLLVDRRGFRRAPLRLVREIRRLRRTRYDLTIDCKPEPSLSNTIVVLLSRSTWRMGFDHEFSRPMYSYTIPGGPRPGAHESARLHALFGDVWDGPTCGPMEFYFPQDRAPWREPEGVSMHIGGHGRKRIPLEVLVSVIAAVQAAGHRLTVFSGPEEESLARELEARIEGLRVTRPPDVVALALGIAGSRVFIGPDTGALHIASALDVPTVNLCRGTAIPAFATRSSRHAVFDFSGDGVVVGTMAFLRTVFEAPVDST